MRRLRHQLSVLHRDGDRKRGGKLIYAGVCCENGGVDLDARPNDRTSIRPAIDRRDTAQDLASEELAALRIGHHDRAVTAMLIDHERGLETCVDSTMREEGIVRRASDRKAQTMLAFARNEHLPGHLR